MRRVVLVTLIIGVAIGGVFAGLLAGGVFGQGKTPPQESDKPPAKWTVEALMTLEQATVDAGPRAPKSNLASTPVPTPPSCPVDPAGVRTWITAPILMQPLWPDIFGGSSNRKLDLVRDASGLTDNGAPYRILSGALTSDPEQGVIVVGLGAKDPCAEGRRDYPPQEYLTPFKGGAVTLTNIVGDTVDFQAADGTTGRLNYVTGTFQ